jgi:hypothetical protein
LITRWVVDMSLGARRRVLPWCRIVLGKVASTTTIVANVGASSHMLLQQMWVQHILLWCQSPMLLLLHMGVISISWSIDHNVVLWRSTAGWYCHSLPLLPLLVSMNSIINYNGIAQKFWKSPRSVTLVVKPLMK